MMMVIIIMKIIMVMIMFMIFTELLNDAAYDMKNYICRLYKVGG